MPSWSEIITDVDLYSNAAVELDKKREKYLNKLDKFLISKIVGNNIGGRYMQNYSAKG